MVSTVTIRMPTVSRVETKILYMNFKTLNFMCIFSTLRLPLMVHANSDPMKYVCFSLTYHGKGTEYGLQSLILDEEDRLCEHKCSERSLVDHLFL